MCHAVLFVFCIVDEQLLTISCFSRAHVTALFQETYVRWLITPAHVPKTTAPPAIVWISGRL